MHGSGRDIQPLKIAHSPKGDIAFDGIMVPGKVDNHIPNFMQKVANHFDATALCTLTIQKDQIQMRYQEANLPSKQTHAERHGVQVG